MIRTWPVLGLMASVLSLQGCVALAIPVVAAGVIGKKQVDAARMRTKQAEAGFDQGTAAALPPVVPEVFVGTAAAEAEEISAAGNALDRLNQAGVSNVYLAFARHAIGEAAKRERDEAVQGVVLENNVSLLYPRAIGCGAKPMAAIIDLDVAPGTPSEMDIERQSGFALLLDTIRESGVRIAWLAETDETRLRPILSLLREGDTPVMRDSDIMLVDLPGNARKQERRWQLAQSHCVVAIAGDRKSDFDELYQYLRDQSYAIRLEAFAGRGWFELPHPVTAIDSERLEISSEQKADQ